MTMMTLSSVCLAMHWELEKGPIGYVSIGFFIYINI